MNTIVSVASLASATALTSPALSHELTIENSRQATVARAEEMVEILRDRVVCSGWHEHFDERRAAEFLEAVRGENYGADNDPAQTTVMAWMNDHGQSFDWLYDGDPVALVCGAAGRSLIAAAIPTGLDPIFAAIAAYRQTSSECFAVSRQLDEAEVRVHKAGHKRPCPLIAWRNYSHIGGSEIEHARDEFLAAPGANKELIEFEYLDAKRRAHRAQLKERRWYKIHGLTELSTKSEQLWSEFGEVGRRLEITIPTTPAGAGALIALIHEEKEEGSQYEWHMPALANVARMMRTMEARS